MPSVFISYRRLPSAMLAQLIARELEARGIRAYVDTRQTDGGGPFPERLLHAIEQEDVFVCLVAEGTFESDWVLREVEHAYALGKLMIPVFQESYTPLQTPPSPALMALLESDGVHIMDVRNIYVDEALNDLANMVLQSARQSAGGRRIPWRWIVDGVGVLIVIAIALFFALRGTDDSGKGVGGTPTPPALAQQGTSTPAPTYTARPSVTPIPAATATDRPVSMATPNVLPMNDINYVLVRGGCFTMGTTDGRPDEAPPHRVCVDDFYMGQTEITNEQYRACVAVGQCTPPANQDYYLNYPDSPVAFVDWQQARDFATWAGAQLPTEAQWEYAASGESSIRPYPWGGDDPTCDRAVIEGCSGSPLPVGPNIRLAGASWAGALDMAGNVWEWVEDYYGEYDSAPQDNPHGPLDGFNRVARGGSFDGTPEDVRVVVRASLAPDTASAHLGFRLAITQ